MKRTILAVAIATAASATAFTATAQTNNQNLEEVTIIGSREAAQSLPGSGTVVDFEQMQIESANDINQLLKTVPGIYILEEDGYGLRPNIGIRGATSERSSKVTLMEDGVLIAPAPYSNRTARESRRLSNTSTMPTSRSPASSSRSATSALRVTRNGTHSRTSRPGKKSST